MDFMSEAFREVNREHLHLLWRKSQAGEMEGLDEEERRLAEIMLDHSDEYFNQFEFADVLAGREFDAIEETNPFLHVAIHACVEKQVEDRDPIEAFQFYNAMLRNKCNRHEAIHLLMTIFLRFLFPILKQKKGHFNLDIYLNLLKKYKFRKPEKIFDLLEGEPDPVINEEGEFRGDEVFEEMRTALNGQKFRSIDEAQTFMDDLMAKKNAEPKPEFLGLSSEQMSRILYRPFTETSDILTLNRNLLNEDFLGIPVVKETVYFLKRFVELQPLRATVKGNLPQAFAREMHDKFPEHPRFHFPIGSEEDDWKLFTLRHLLDMAGWVKKRKEKFSLTQKGEKIVRDGFGVNDFCHLFEIHTQKFNWSFGDFFPDLEIIQESILFSCYLLHKKANTYIHADQLSGYFIRAFPAVLDRIERDPYSEPEDDVHHAFCLRFLERFCEYFGLLTIQREEKMPPFPKYSVKTTPLFEKMFHWKLKLGN